VVASSAVAGRIERGDRGSGAGKALGPFCVWGSAARARRSARARARARPLRSAARLGRSAPLGRLAPLGGSARAIRYRNQGSGAARALGRSLGRSVGRSAPPSVGRAVGRSGSPPPGPPNKNEPHIMASRSTFSLLARPPGPPGGTMGHPPTPPRRIFQGIFPLGGLDFADGPEPRLVVRHGMELDSLSSGPTGVPAPLVTQQNG
jgi:hypothetical protein